MPDDPESLVIRLLQQMHAKMDRFEIKLDRVLDDVADLKRRMTAAEEAIVGLSRRMDRIDLRLDRIERRLELSDEPTR